MKFYKDEARGSLENDKGRLRDDEEESLFEALEQETISCGNDRGKDQSVGVFHKQTKECTIRDRTQDGHKISFREGGIGSISKVQVIHITHSLTHSLTHKHIHTHRYRVTLCNPTESWELSHDSQTSFLKFLSEIKTLLRKTRSVHAISMFRRGKMSWNDLRLEMLRHAPPATSIDSEWYYYDEDDVLMNERGPFSTQEMYERIRSDFDDNVVIEPLRVGNTRGGPYPYSTKDCDQIQDLKLALLLVMARTFVSRVDRSYHIVIHTHTQQQLQVRTSRDAQRVFVCISRHVIRRRTTLS